MGDERSLNTGLSRSVVRAPVRWSTSWRIQALSCLMISGHFTTVSRIFSQPTSARFIDSSPSPFDARPYLMVFPTQFASLRPNTPKTDEAHMGQRHSGMMRLGTNGEIQAAVERPRQARAELVHDPARHHRQVDRSPLRSMKQNQRGANPSRAMVQHSK